MVKDLVPFTGKRQEMFEIDVNKFLESNTSKEKIQENLKVLPDVLTLLSDKVKNFDIVEFVTRNTNIY